MRFASSDRRGTSRLGRLVPLGALVALALLAGGAGAVRSEHGGPAVRGAESRFVVGTLGPAERRRVAASDWQGGVFTASTGEQVRVLVDDSYPDPRSEGQKWANFFASLVHGSELGLLTAYVVTPDDMSDGSNQLAFMDETVAGVTPEEVAPHEYGHHVAANRSNAPWTAIDTGPKRWASVVNVCQRTQAGTAFPGDEDVHYRQNPGEAWAETYRVLNELTAGATSFTWSLVDGSFYPTSAALQAAAEDVASGWSAPVTGSFKGQFVRNGKKVWRVTVSTPFDGDLAVTLSMPRGALDDLTVFAPDGHTVLAKGLWFSSTAKRLTSTVCGERSLVVQVRQRGTLGRFALKVTHD
jgi:hypothetical protein